MKTKFLILALSLIAFGTYRAEAQVDVTVNPLGLLLGGINVGADFVLSDDFSIEGTIGYNSRKGTQPFDSSSGEYKYTGVPVQAVGKYYFSPTDGADGFYAAGFLRYVNRTYNKEGSDNNDNDFSQSRFGLGVGAGVKSVSNKNVVFDFGVNIGRVIADKTKYESANSQQEVNIGGIIFTLKLGIGYRFGG